MQVIVNIEKCSDCRHCDHSGAFTPGGAKPMCGHPHQRRKLPYTEVPIPDNERRMYPLSQEYEFIVTEIPEWCPLKHGEKY